MRFLPTVNLWDRSVQAAIQSGQLKLQIGQWCKCGSGSELSRFVAYRNGIFDVVHYPDGGRKKFLDRVRAYKRSKFFKQ